MGSHQKAPGFSEHQELEGGTRTKTSFGEAIQKSCGGVGLEGLFTPLHLSSLNTNFRNPGGPLVCGVVQRPTL